MPSGARRTSGRCSPTSRRSSGNSTGSDGGLAPATFSRSARARLDRRAPALEEGRQRQPLAERLQRLVDGEAGAVGGDLEEDAVRLAEVERAEVVAVDLAARAARRPAPGAGSRRASPRRPACGRRRGARRPRPAAPPAGPAAPRRAAPPPAPPSPIAKTCTVAVAVGRGVVARPSPCASPGSAPPRSARAAARRS